MQERLAEEDAKSHQEGLIYGEGDAKSHHNHHRDDASEFDTDAYVDVEDDGAYVYPQGASGVPWGGTLSGGNNTHVVEGIASAVAAGLNSVVGAQTGIVGDNKAGHGRVDGNDVAVMPQQLLQQEQSAMVEDSVQDAVAGRGVELHQTSQVRANVAPRRRSPTRVGSGDVGSSINIKASAVKNEQSRGRSVSAQRGHAGVGIHDKQSLGSKHAHASGYGVVSISERYGIRMSGGSMMSGGGVQGDTYRSFSTTRMPFRRRRRTPSRRNLFHQVGM
jgi:hypothetical protein